MLDRLAKGNHLVLNLLFPTFRWPRFFVVAARSKIPPFIRFT
jgi:hypothetical protein